MRHIFAHGPVNMRVFIEESGVSQNTAKAILDQLVDEGIFSVEVVVPRPVGAVVEISLTNDGRRIAEHSIAMLDARDRARKKRSA